MFLRSSAIAARYGALIPERLAIPDCGGQVEDRSAGRIALVPRYWAAIAVKAGESIQKTCPVILLPRQRRHYNCVGCDFVDGVGQYGVGAQFDEGVVAVGDQ